MSYTIATVTILWHFVQTFSKHSSLELRNFLRRFPALKQTLFNSTPQQKHAVTSLEDRNAFTSNKPDHSQRKSVITAS
jgi:hypothetical protein